jgi:hypothetical protein
MCVAALAAPLLGGCAQGVGVGAGSDGDGSQGLADYDFRAPLELSNAPADAAVRLTINHAALVDAGSALPDGSDFRIGFTDANGVTTELARMIDPATEWDSIKTSLFFRSQPAEATEGSYFVYYGNPDAEAPTGEPPAVFDLFDDFDILDSEWKLDEIGEATAADASLVDGAVRVAGITGDLGGTADDIVFLNRPVSGDFLVEVELSGAGGSLNGAAKMGGVMVRQSAAPESRHLTVSLQRTPRTRATFTRMQDGGDTTTTELPAPETFPQFFRVERIDGKVTAQYSEDGLTYVGLGPSVDLGMTDPVLVGIPVANISGGAGHVDVDWFRIREALLPEPIAKMGEEEAN